MTVRSPFLAGTTALLMVGLVQFAQFGSDARAASEKAFIPSNDSYTYPKVYPGEIERNKLKAAGINLEGVAPVTIGVIEPLPTEKARIKKQAEHLAGVLSVIKDAKAGLYPHALIKVYRCTAADFETHPFFVSKEALDAFIEDDACDDFVCTACMLRHILDEPVQKPTVLSFSWSYCRTEICNQLLRELRAYPRQMYPVLVELVGTRYAQRFRSLNLKYPADGSGGLKQMSLDDWWWFNELDPKILQALARHVDTVIAHSDRVRVVRRDYIECTRRIAEAGIFMVVCAGNQGLDEQEFRATPGASLSFLAESPYVISVGGYEELDAGSYSIAYFSSSGSPQYHPVILGPGFFFARNGERSTGTSISAPYVAATIALMLQQNPELSLQQITSILKSTAHPLKSVSPLLQGAGRVDVCAAVKGAQRARKGPDRSGAG